ncbi:hypothetical protein BDW59DRAFT_151555 [Aspergillus cavernicola]|uniref:GPI-anchored cell wall organization protein Ecm33 n=1 Tax=Aspergillus cavernicola TaxID=176166 RepID=A0ABR4HUU1_9EURO
MISVKSLFALLLVTGVVPIGISAQDCYANATETDTESRLILSSPDQLSAFDGCTTIIGDILIDKNFAGSIVLNGVTNFTGTIASYGYAVTTVVDAIEMPDALYINRLGLHNARMVRRLSLPRVERMAAMWLYQPAGDSSFDLGALKDISLIYMSGPGTNVSFPSLETITNDFTLVTDLLSPSDDRAPIDVHLPALREVEGLNIKGPIRSLLTPNVEAIGSGGMWVEARYEDLPGVLLPSLARLGARVSLSGHIKRVDLGGMQETNASITIKAESPVEINSALQNAGDIDLSGELQAVNFDDISHATEMSINSTTLSQCPPSLVEVYRELNRPREAEFCDSNSLQLAGDNPWADYVSPIPNPGPTPTPTQTPSWTPTPTPSPVMSPGPVLSTGALAGIIVVIAVLGSAAIAAFWIRRYRKKIPGEKTAGDVPAGRDLPPHVNFDDAPPPPYSRDPQK